MIELSQHLGFAFKVFDGFSALTLIGEHLDHLFDRTEPVCKPFVAGLIHRSHPTAADAVDDRISVQQKRSSFELLARGVPWFLRVRHTILSASAAGFYNDRWSGSRQRVLPGPAFTAERV